MKISAINNYNFNKINFESKKSRDIQPAAHTTSTLKAVPLAVLLAMSPLNAPKAQISPLNMPMWNFYYNPKNVVIGRDPVKNATPNNEYKCTIHFVSNNGNDNTTEILRFVFEKDYDALKHDENGNKVRFGTNHFTREINFAQLVKEEHNVKNEDGTITQFFKYYIEGPGIDKTETKSDSTGMITHVSTAKLNKLSMEITKEFYDELLPVAMFYADGNKKVLQQQK